MTIDLCLRMKPECELYPLEESKMNQKSIDKLESEVFSLLPPLPEPPSTRPLFAWLQQLRYITGKGGVN